MHVGHDGDWARIGIVAHAVRVGGPKGIRPVQGLVHRQEVRCSAQAVHPVDHRRFPPVVFDGEGGVEVPISQGGLYTVGAVAPNGRHTEVSTWHTGHIWQDLLLELLHGDLVVFGVLCARNFDLACTLEDRRFDQRHLVLGDQ